MAIAIPGDDPPHGEVIGMDGREPTALQWRTDKAEPIATDIKNLWIIPGDIGLFRLTSETDLFIKSLNSLIPLDFDVVLMDCPPSQGLASVQAILNSDRVKTYAMAEAEAQTISIAILGALVRDRFPSVYRG